MEYTVAGILGGELTLGATGIEDILQCVRIILATQAWSAPLDRKFAHHGDFIDRPVPSVIHRDLAELAEAVERYEPRVRVLAIDWSRGSPSAAMDGRLTPIVRIEILEGAL